MVLQLKCSPFHHSWFLWMNVGNLDCQVHRVHVSERCLWKLECARCESVWFSPLSDHGRCCVNLEHFPQNTLQGALRLCSRFMHFCARTWRDWLWQWNDLCSLPTVPETDCGNHFKVLSFFCMGDAVKVGYLEEKTGLKIYKFSQFPGGLSLFSITQQQPSCDFDFSTRTFCHPYDQFTASRKVCIHGQAMSSLARSKPHHHENMLGGKKKKKNKSNEVRSDFQWLWQCFRELMLFVLVFHLQDH